MTLEETKKLFAMLKVYFPRAEQVKDDNNLTVRSWHLALEPYLYEEVRANVIRYVRDNHFFPDIADLTCNLLACNSMKRIQRNADWLDRFLSDQEYENDEDCGVNLQW